MTAFAAFFVRNWQFTLVLFIMLAVTGLNSVTGIPRAEDPVFPIPITIVTAALPGADAEDVEKLIVDPIEDVIDGLEDVKELESTARDGLAVVVVEFEWSVDAMRKYDEVIREVNAIRERLPAQLARLEFERATTAGTNIVQAALVSGTLSDLEMRRVGRELQDEIDRVAGVRGTDLWGETEPEIRVAVDLGKLAELRLPVTRVAEALQAEGVAVPAGAIHMGERRLNVKATGDFDSLEEIGAVVVAAFEGRVVHVRDVATVAWAADEARHIVRHKGQRAIFLTVQLQEGQNIFPVRDRIYAAFDAFEPRLPEGLVLERGFDQSQNVADRLGKLFRDFAIALGLVLITLLPLGFRAALVVMISIPLSLSIGVTLLFLTGFTLNQLSIAGMVLSLGLLVDDSIVVTENIARHLRMGYSRRDAAVAGMGQIAIAVLGCTATLMLAFVPVLFLPEGSGRFIRSLPAAVLYTVGASLFVALTIIPFLASRMLSEKEDPEGNVVLRAVMGGIHGVYRPLLHVALSRPVTTLVLAFGLSVASLMLIPRLGFSLFPTADTPQFVIDVRLPDGASMAETDRAVRFVERVLDETPEVVWHMGNVGHENPRVFYNIFSRDSLPNVGAVFVSLKEWRWSESPAVLDRMRARFAGYPGAQIVIRTFVNGPPIDAPIAVRISGPEIPQLKALAAEVERRVLAVEGARDVVNPVRIDRTDLNLGIDPAKAAALGVPAGAADRVARLALSGEEVARFRETGGAGDDFPIRVRLDLAGGAGAAGPRHELETLSRIYVPAAQGAAPLSSIAAPHFEASASQIARFQRERVVTITAYEKTGYLASGVTADVRAALADVELPPGYRIGFGGQAEAQASAFAGLSTAIVIAVFGILAVLVLEFRSFAASAVVAGVIPLGILGGLFALWLTNNSLSFTAVIGFIALIGIEIKNSILLVDFTTQLRRKGVELKEAIEQAGEIRFLPVLLTSATAIGGLTPLALEESGLYSPLAIVIIGGLVSSTFLSRIVTPVMYLLLAPEEELDPEYAAAADRAAPAE